MSDEPRLNGEKLLRQFADEVAANEELVAEGKEMVDELKSLLDCNTRLTAERDAALAEVETLRAAGREVKEVGGG